jgi:polyisoprenyl-phosphate glycosyltransferase
MQQAIILCPLFKDEASFRHFAAEVEKESETIQSFKLSFLVVNDGTDSLRLSSNLPMRIIHLHRNIGHQKAIAIGLAYAHHHLQFDRLIIMDCDGEDRPADIKNLLTSMSSIAVAKRMSRQEGRGFRFFYYLYKLLFFVLVGKPISFGNFMALTKNEADKLVYYSELWNHLAGTVIKSKLPFTYIESHRGKRYEGNSKMNFTSLLLHGLGAIGVFIEIVASRLMLFSLLLIAIAVASILIILYVKYFTTRAIPGWTTTTVSAMLIVILQSFLLSLFTIFIYLSFQAQRKFIPAYHYNDYVRSVETTNND